MTDLTTPPVNSASAGVLLDVDVQSVLEDNDTEEPPSPAALSLWAESAYSHIRSTPAEVTIRLVDQAEMKQLNQQFRGRDTATNVLSFPFESPPHIAAELELALLGDVVICHSVIVEQARLQAKCVADHYAHMVTHGLLHLCGFDHQSDDQAATMESMEVEILSKHAIANPYD